MCINGPDRHVLSLTVIENVLVHHQGALIRESASSDFRVSLPTSYWQGRPCNFILHDNRNSSQPQAHVCWLFRGKHTCSSLHEGQSIGLTLRII